jgi:PAS domain-containing protein
MRLVCSYCRRVIRADPGSRVTDVSHGMCEPCGQHFGRLWSGMPIDEYLDGLAAPVLVVDEDTRVVTMNQQLADLIGVDRKSVEGLRGGEAFACVRSRLPEGCGGTVHCRECGVRRTVQQVARTGQMHERVSAYVDTDRGRVALRISGRPGHRGTVQVTIEELGEPRPRRGAA